MARLRSRMRRCSRGDGYGAPYSTAESSGISNLAMQRHLKVSSTHDAAERQARDTADRVVDGNLSVAANSSFGGAKHANHQGGEGRPLPDPVRSYFEPRLHQDLGSVRFRDDDSAHGEASDLNARAFTQGNTISFAHGQFNPNTRAGKHLLAHELVHASGMHATESNKIYRETWDVDDSARTVERGILVQLNFENTWEDMVLGTGWTDARKTTFRSEFENAIESTFNSSSVMLNPPASAADVLPADVVANGYQPLVDIALVDDGAWSMAEDWEIDVASNPRSEFRTSSSSRSYGTFDEADNTPVEKEGAPAGVTQTPSVHEFGHFIGLDHPGVGLEETWFSDSQLSPGADEYTHSGTDSEGRAVDGPNDLLGTGMGLHPFYFNEWAQAVDAHIAALRTEQNLQEWQRRIDEMFIGTPEKGDFPVMSGPTRFG